MSQDNIRVLPFGCSALIRNVNDLPFRSIVNLSKSLDKYKGSQWILNEDDYQVLLGVIQEEGNEQL